MFDLSKYNIQNPFQFLKVHVVIWIAVFLWSLSYYCYCLNLLLSEIFTKVRSFLLFVKHFELMYNGTFVQPWTNVQPRTFVHAWRYVQHWTYVQPRAKNYNKIDHSSLGHILIMNKCSPRSEVFCSLLNTLNLCTMGHLFNLDKCST